MCECNNENKIFVSCGNVIVRVAEVNIIILDSKIIHIFDKHGISQDVLFKSKKSAQEAFDFMKEDLGIK